MVLIESSAVLLLIVTSMDGFRAETILIVSLIALHARWTTKTWVLVPAWMGTEEPSADRSTSAKPTFLVLVDQSVSIWILQTDLNVTARKALLPFCPTRSRMNQM